MITQNTVELLSKLSPINDSMILNYPVTAVGTSEQMQGYLNMQTLGEDEFVEYGIYSFQELFQILNILENPELTSSKTQLIVNADNDGVHTEIKYGLGAVNTIEEHRYSPNKLAMVESGTCMSEFDLSSDALGKISRASKVFNLTILKIDSLETGTNLEVTSSISSKNNYNITAPGTGKVSCSIIVDFLDKVPSDNYKVKVYSDESGVLHCVFESIAIPALKIVIQASS